MSTPVEHYAQTSQRLAEVEALHQTLSGVLQELTAYRDLLTQKLELLQQESKPAVPEFDFIAEEAAPVAEAVAEAEEVPDWAMDAPAVPAPMPFIPPDPPRKAPEPKRAKSNRDTLHLSPEKTAALRAEVRARTPAVATSEADAQALRTAPRRSGNPVSVQLRNPALHDDEFQGWVVDRSSGGLGILVDQPVAVNSVLHVRPTKAHSSLPTVQIQVKSCRPERSSFNIGCQFVQKLSWSELQMFG